MIDELSPSLAAENAELRAQLAEARDTLRAIHAGEVEALVVRGPDGPLIYTLQGLDDATRRFQGQIIEQVGEAVVAIDQDQRLTFLNLAAERLYGVTRSYALGRELTDIWETVWPDPDLEAAAAAALRNHGEWRGENIHVLRDGRTMLVEVSITVMKDEHGTFGGLLGVIRDISARHVTEMALKESEARLRLAASVGGLGFGKIDYLNHTVRMNGVAAKLFGLSPDMSVLRSQVHSRFHPDDEPAIRRAMEAALDPRGNGEMALDHRVVRPDGSVAWISARKKIEFTSLPDGRRCASTGMLAVWEITDRVEAVAALRDSEERLAAAISNASLSVYELDIQHERLHWDERIREIWGFSSSEEVTYESFLDGIHPVDQARVHDAAQRARDPQGSGKLDAKYQVVNRQTGAPRWVHDISEVRFRDGRAVRMLGIVKDITVDKQAEARLERSEARFRAAVKAVSGIVWTNNARGEMEGEQPGWAALTGQSFVEYQGYGWAAAVHPEDTQRTIDAWNAAVAAVKNAYFEHRIRRYDGVWRHFSVCAIPVFDEAGELQEWVGVHTDVTEQRDAEAILTRDRGELEQLVAERTRTLAETEQRLTHAQRIQALGQLAGGIAHDFNNVLQAVDGGAKLIERRADGSEEIRHLARMVMDAANRGASITRRLLTFSRRGDLQTETVDAVKLLADLREVLAHTLGGGIRVEMGIPDALSLLADKAQLETVLVNLVTNARDAMNGKGIITLGAEIDTLRAGQTSNHLSADGAEHHVRLWVTDTGCGMAPDVLARASEPFFTTKGAGNGTGLGLAMARGFAEQSGGAFHIASAPGQGTTVSLWFPLAQQSASDGSLEKEKSASIARLPSASLLVVDDEPMVGEMLAEGLRSVGYRVTQVSSGATALVLLDAGEVDLIISDLSMPEMDGLELADEVRQRRPDIPLILLTGYVTDAAELVAGRGRNDIFALLRKPVTAEQLAECVAALLEQTIKA